MERAAGGTETVSRFLRRRIEELAGVALLALGAAFLLALASYDRGDPSFNRAVDAPVRNLMGRTGAYAADLLWQSVGLAALLVPIVLLAWGWRLAAHRMVSQAPFRLIAFFPTLLALATAVAAAPVPASWPLQGGFGGFTGGLLLQRLGGLESLLGPIGLALVLVATAAVGVAGATYVVGLSRQEWGVVGRQAGFAAGLIGRAVAAFGGWLIGLWSGRRSAAEPARPKPARTTVAEARGGERIEPVFARRAVAPAAGDDDEIEADAPAVAAAPVPPIPESPRPTVAVDLGGRREKPAAKKVAAAKQAALDLAVEGEHRLPPLDLLAPIPPVIDSGIDETALANNAKLLEGVLDDFGVKGQIVKVRPGPVVTLYELEPAPGTKSSRVIGLADDIARSMSALAVRVAVVPGRNVIGIELPNRKAETVWLRELLAADAYEKTAAQLMLAIGKDIGGTPVIADLSRMPHLLIAGTTGSGKSVGINAMILSLLYRLPPDRCKFIMIDPKMLELSVYDGIPHLLAPVVTDPRKAVVALKWTVREMENRYRAMSQLGVRNIEGFNARLTEMARRGENTSRKVQTGFDPETGEPVFEEQPLDLRPLPFIVVVVDEMADLMLVAGKDIEAAIQRLAQMARAAGIHIIMATQRPSVDVITGTIKANFPTRISFQVTSKIDSRTILGEAGAEQLLGRGDMLYMQGGGRITRVHGPFVRDDEVEEVVKFLKAQGEPAYLDEVTEDELALGGESGGAGADEDGDGDGLYEQAVQIVIRERKASTSFIQRHLQIGYNRAARLVERMEAAGVISTANHVGKREVLWKHSENA
ncbi:MAG: DNA translocase FtsK 4TM domain-containing protein [Alphaproteobacteria bacterium]|nr:DNA translocase FtsK 4TM domain-containing protein [Alphaproteobacteria bacterium]